jgi:hypothetical protein
MTRIYSEQRTGSPQAGRVREEDWPREIRDDSGCVRREGRNSYEIPRRGGQNCPVPPVCGAHTATR